MRKRALLILAVVVVAGAVAVLAACVAGKDQQVTPNQAAPQASVPAVTSETLRGLEQKLGSGSQGTQAEAFAPELRAQLNGQSPFPAGSTVKIHDDTRRSDGAYTRVEADLTAQGQTTSHVLQLVSIDGQWYIFDTEGK